MYHQNYDNHKRQPPIVSLVIATFSFLILFFAVWNIYYCRAHGKSETGSKVVSLLTFTILFTTIILYLIKTYKECRDIVKEENARFKSRVGYELPDQLTLRQILALRYASNDEFVPLVRAAVRDKLKPDVIKRSITSWRADKKRI
jgi:Family of unknown function (DUF6526)